MFLHANILHHSMKNIALISSIALMFFFSHSATAQWSLTGNGSTIQGTHFVGTTDAKWLQFRANNIHAGMVRSDQTNTLYGIGSGSQYVVVPAPAGATGQQNTLIGFKAGLGNLGGINNSFLGAFAGTNNTSGKDNSIVGAYAGWLNSTGSDNIFVGSHAGYKNQIGTSNTFVGKYAGFSSEGTGNTFLGIEAGMNTSTIQGSFNTFVGRHSGFNNTTGNDNTILGNYADVSTGNLTNSTAIGCQAVVNANHKIRLGNTFITVIEGQVPYTWPSDARFKKNVSEKVAGLNLIMRLRPVTYNFNYSKFSEFLGEKEADKSILAQREKQMEMGFLAQDVEKTLKEMGLNVSNLVHAPESEHDNYSLAYAQLVVPLVKAVQEQQGIIQQQNSKIENLEGRLQKLESILLNTINTESSTYLGQNMPNPFNGLTNITYELPRETKNGTIVIHSLEGKRVKSIKLDNCCGTVQVDLKDFPNGTLIYSLFADGKLLESKKMILNR